MLKLSEQSLEWALKHAERHGDGIFETPFEFEAIRHDWNAVGDYLSGQDVLEWETRSHRVCLVPKQIFAFRIANQLDPLDWLFYTALIYDIGNDLEARRLPVEDGIVYSNRFAPTADGLMFSNSPGWSEFQRNSKERCASGEFEYVVVADIADFFAKLGHHQIDNALRSATAKTNHAVAIGHLLKKWREKISFGIPVGPFVSKLIAEVTIDDIDRTLLAEQLAFTRYVDDFRIFCRSRNDAQIALGILADALWKNHGLTFQQQKTMILPIHEFQRRHLRAERDAELSTLKGQFETLAAELGLDNWYEPIDYEDLEPDQRRMIDELNLEQLLADQLQEEHIDIQMTRFILRRLAQFDSSDVSEVLLKGIDKLYPVFTDVVGYLGSSNEGTRKALGAKVLGLLDDSIVAHLEYHRMNVLALFASEVSWNNAEKLPALFQRFPDAFSQRELTLAMGTAGQGFYFRNRRTTWQELGPWVRRAFIRGASCLPSDERNHWYASIDARLDPIERAITRWSKQSPVGKS